MGKKLVAVRLDPEVIEALAAYKDKKRVPVTEQVDLAIRAWFKGQRITVPARKSGKPRR